MTYLRDLLHEGDLCSLGFAVVGLFYIGRLFVQGRPRLHDWGVRLAAVAFILFGLLRLVESRRPLADDILSAVFVGAAAAGLVVGPGWIVMGCAAFVGDYIARANQMAQRRRDRARYVRDERRRRVQEERRRRTRESEERRLAPLRRRQNQVVRRRELESQRRTHIDRMRREEARLSCLLHFDRHRRKLGKRFPRRQLLDYFESYMSDRHSAEQVEARALQLKSMLSQLAELQLATPIARFQSVTEIEAYYAEEREAIVASSYNQDMKDTLLVDVNREEDRALQELRRR